MSQHHKKVPSTLYNDVVEEIKYKSSKWRKAKQSRKQIEDV